MAHTIVIKLNKAANEFQAGESIGFNVRGGVQYYDRKTKQKEWTNYSGVVFAKAPGQIDFYRSALVEGAVIELSGKTQKIDIYDGGQNGPSYTIELQDAWLGNIQSPNQGQSASMGQPQQGGYAPQGQQQGGFASQQPMQQPAQQPPGFNQQAYNQQQANQQEPQQQGNQGGFHNGQR